MSSSGAAAGSTDPGTVTVEQRGPVLIMTLNRPRSRNAVTTVMAQELQSALYRLDDDPALRVGIVTGAGGYFCAGQDLGEALRGEFAKTPDRGWFGIVGRPANKPLIAAVEGFALAGGLEVVLSCDLVVAAENARFGVPEIHNGQVAAAGGLIRLPLRLPYHVATAMALTGDPVDAPTLHRHGLVTEIAPPGGALEQAMILAGRIHANPPGATRLTLDILRTTAAMIEAPAWSYQNAVLSTYAQAGNPEYAEGVTAFLEKRPPSWAAAAQLTGSTSNG